MDILISFALRLTFGLASAMVATPTRWVSSGYYRVNSYVLLGLNVLAAAAASSDLERFPWRLAAIGGALSYAAAVCFLVERPRAGVAMLIAVAAASLGGAWQVAPAAEPTLLHWLDPPSGGLVLGSTLAAMLLGHWYLNSPTMRLDPLRRLVLLMGACLAMRLAVAGVGLAGELQADWPRTDRLLFMALRWLAGFAGTGTAAVMAWQTLKIPNPQSATGLLYVAVIMSFLGELTSQLLSVESRFPL